MLSPRPTERVGISRPFSLPVSSSCLWLVKSHIWGYAPGTTASYEPWTRQCSVAASPEAPFTSEGGRTVHFWAWPGELLILTGHQKEQDGTVPSEPGCQASFPRATSILFHLYLVHTSIFSSWVANYNLFPSPFFFPPQCDMQSVVTWRKTPYFHGSRLRFRIFFGRRIRLSLCQYQ